MCDLGLMTTSSRFSGSGRSLLGLGTKVQMSGAPSHANSAREVISAATKGEHVLAR